MRKITRRHFLQLSGGTLASLLLPKALLAAPLDHIPSDQEGLEPPPASFGRIITWWVQTVHKSPSFTSKKVSNRSHDEILPLYGSIIGEAPWPSNPIWYRTIGGFIHSGYVQPVENTPNPKTINRVIKPGFWAEVCVPYAEARWQPNNEAYVSRKLYYQTVYRVVDTAVDEEDNTWYQLQEGITHSPGPYVLASTMRRISRRELTPISAGHPDKWIQIDIQKQTLTCIEGEHVVFTTRTASGVHNTATPKGEFRVLYKRHTRRMVGEDYDLAGVPFPVYFTTSGVAIHGTYWHNDYGRRHSHGCLNVQSSAARWVFRWVEPIARYTTYTQDARPGQGTRVVVI